MREAPAEAENSSLAASALEKVAAKVWNGKFQNSASFGIPHGRGGTVVSGALSGYRDVVTVTMRVGHRW